MATAEITDEIKDLQSNVALTLLNELKAQNKISPEMYLFSEKLSLIMVKGLISLKKNLVDYMMLLFNLFKTTKPFIKRLNL